MDILKVFVENFSHDVNILVNQGFFYHRGSHETAVVILLGGTAILHLTEVNGVDLVHLYRTACLVYLLDKIHHQLEIIFS